MHVKKSRGTKLFRNSASEHRCTSVFGDPGTVLRAPGCDVPARRGQHPHLQHGGLSSEVQKACQIWSLTFWPLTVPSLHSVKKFLLHSIECQKRRIHFVQRHIHALRAFLGRARGARAPGRDAAPRSQPLWTVAPAPETLRRFDGMDDLEAGEIVSPCVSHGRLGCMNGFRDYEACTWHF